MASSITTAIRNVLEQCPQCQKHANRQQREPLISHEIPELPWTRVAMDMEFQSKNVLVVVDFYSHFPELRVLKKKSSLDVVYGSEVNLRLSWCCP